MICARGRRRAQGIPAWLMPPARQRGAGQMGTPAGAAAEGLHVWSGSCLGQGGQSHVGSTGSLPEPALP